MSNPTPQYVNGDFYSFASIDIATGLSPIVIDGGAGISAPGLGVGGSLPGLGGAGAGGSGGAGAGGSVGLGGRSSLLLGFKSIDYSDKNARGKPRSNFPVAIGRTIGDYDAQGSIGLLKGYAEDFINIITQDGKVGRYEAFFSLTVSYGEPGRRTIVDRLINCCLSDDGQSGQQGTSASERKFSLDIGVLSLDGKPPFTGRRIPRGMPRR